MNTTPKKQKIFSLVNVIFNRNRTLDNSTKAIQKKTSGSNIGIDSDKDFKIDIICKKIRFLETQIAELRKLR